MSPEEMMALPWNKASMTVHRMFEDMEKMNYREGEALTGEQHLARQIQNDAFLRDVEITPIVRISGWEPLPQLDGVSVISRTANILSVRIGFDGLLSLLQEKRVTSITFQ